VTAAEYLATIEALGLTQVGTGRMLGLLPGKPNGSPRATRRYEALAHMDRLNVSAASVERLE
jgi:hypothetical protein